MWSVIADTDLYVVHKVWGIPKKDQFDRPSRQFIMTRMEIVNKTNGTKYMRGNSVKRMLRKQKVRNFTALNKRRHTIYNIIGSKNNVAQKLQWWINLYLVSLSRINEMTLFKFRHTILLWCETTRLMYDAMRSHKWFKGRKMYYFCIIIVQNPHCFFKSILYL